MTTEKLSVLALADVDCKIVPVTCITEAKNNAVELRPASADCPINTEGVVRRERPTTLHSALTLLAGHVLILRRKICAITDASVPTPISAPRLECTDVRFEGVRSSIKLDGFRTEELEILESNLGTKAEGKRSTERLRH